MNKYSLNIPTATQANVKISSMLFLYLEDKTVAVTGKSSRLESSAQNAHYNYVTSPYETVSCNTNLITNLSHFYEVLLSKQTILDKEFSKVLYDNLWDLYED
jgi:hypothetical protein